MTIHTTCCIAGGGPAGMMCAFLLARAGVPVTVLEKHKDFFRDFRGDTIHPSTFQIMDDLGLLQDFLRLPHQEITTLSAVFNGRTIHLADFSHLHYVKPVLGLMPQWDFLNFLAEKAKKYPTFSLMREAKVTGLLIEEDAVCGVTVQTPDESLDIRCKLVIGADGRSSDVRSQAGLEVIETGVPIDILWFRLSRHEGDPAQTLGNFLQGEILILLNRDTYWQCGYVIDKGGFDTIKSQGLVVFRKKIVGICPYLVDRVGELGDWSVVQLLTITVDHLETWYREGLVCIGDAALAMSPVGGVGINLAIQDAVAAANAFWEHLSKNEPIPETVLSKFQSRRAFPARAIQAVQAKIHEGIHIRRDQKPQRGAPWVMRLVDDIPLLRRIPAWIIGRGFRPERVRTPEVPVP